MLTFVDRRGFSCYSAVYAVYNIAYLVGMMTINAFASVAAGQLKLYQTLLCGHRAAPSIHSASLKGDTDTRNCSEPFQ